MTHTRGHSFPHPPDLEVPLAAANAGRDRFGVGGRGDRLGRSRSSAPGRRTRRGRPAAAGGAGHGGRPARAPAPQGRRPHRAAGRVGADPTGSAAFVTWSEKGSARWGACSRDGGRTLVRAAGVIGTALKLRDGATSSPAEPMPAVSAPVLRCPRAAACSSCSSARWACPEWRAGPGGRGRRGPELLPPQRPHRAHGPGARCRRWAACLRRAGGALSPRLPAGARAARLGAGAAGTGSPRRVQRHGLRVGARGQGRASWPTARGVGRAGGRLVPERPHPRAVGGPRPAPARWRRTTRCSGSTSGARPRTTWTWCARTPAPTGSRTTSAPAARACAARCWTPASSRTTRTSTASSCTANAADSHGTSTYGIVFGNGNRDGDGNAQGTGHMPAHGLRLPGHLRGLRLPGRPLRPTPSSSSRRPTSPPSRATPGASALTTRLQQHLPPDGRHHLAAGHRHHPVAVERRQPALAGRRPGPRTSSPWAASATSTPFEHADDSLDERRLHRPGRGRPHQARRELLVRQHLHHHHGQRLHDRLRRHLRGHAGGGGRARPDGPDVVGERLGHQPARAPRSSSAQPHASTIKALLVNSSQQYPFTGTTTT